MTVRSGNDGEEREQAVNGYLHSKQRSAFSEDPFA